MLLRTMLVTAAFATAALSGAIADTPSPQLKLDLKLSIDGDMIAHPVQTFDEGTEASLSLIKGELKLDVTLAADMCARAETLFPSQKGAEDRCSLIETEVSKSDDGETWSVLATPVMLSAIGEETVYKQQIAHPKGGVCVLEIEAVIREVDA